MIGAPRHPHVTRALAAAILAACMAGPLAAQAPREARVGDEVRVISGAFPGTVRGELLEVRGDSLYVRSDLSRAVAAVPLAEVDRIEVRQRRSWDDGVLHGVMIGAPAGAAGGYLLGLASETGPNACPDGCGLVPVYTATIGLMMGTVVGALFGGFAPGGRWKPTARPGAGGVALSLGIRL